MENTSPKKHVLAVEDDKTSMMILTGMIENMGYAVLEAQDGREALSIIEREGDALDVIVLDKTMPEMDGLEVVVQMNKDPKVQHIPVIMVTGSTRPEEVKEGIDAGVFYYLTKPYEKEIFESVITAAMREAQQRTTLKIELGKHQSSFNFMNRAEFSINKLAEAEDLACFLAYCFPSPDTALPGLASLLVNAIEHGNIGIGYERKSQLLDQGNWREEIEKLEESPENSNKKVIITLERNKNEIKVSIEDEGKGFNWQNYLEIDPARALDNHGRGIAQANKISFDELRYNEKGNIVTAISRLGSGIKW